MALGYCRMCERLVAIKPGPHKPGSRERWWFPWPHDDQDGRPCPGSKRGI